jgi:hypothetical protein
MPSCHNHDYIIVYAMMVEVYTIPHHFHAYSQGWEIMLSKDHAMMIIKICNITLTIMEDASNG